MMGLFAALLMHIASPFGAAPAVSDAVLADQRGGLRLPNGVDVALTVDTRTAINGSVVLQTIVKLDQGAPVVSVYTPAEGQQVAVGTAIAGSTGGTGSAPVVRFDRHSGVTITSAALPATVNVGMARQADTGQPLPGLQKVEPQGSVQTPGGLVSHTGSGTLGRSELRGLDIQIQHLTGRAFGSIIVNSGNDRAIDTVTTISIDLQNAGADVIGSTMFRVENLGIAALSGRF